MFRPHGDGRTIFGRNSNGDLIHIRDARQGKTDLTCPDCGMALIAKKGAIRVHHFAHSNGEECVAAGETALHREAKNVLIATPELLLPKLMVRGKQCLEKRIVRLHSIEIETWEGGFRPDLRATMSIGEVTRILFIEIRVTHAVDEFKLEKVRNAGHSMIEIDLASINREVTRSALSNLLRKTAPREWLHHRKTEEFKAAILEEERQQRLREDEKAQQAAFLAEERRTARAAAKTRAPSKGTAAEERSAAQQVLEWRALGKDHFFALAADDQIFDVPPAVWRARVLSFFAPWIDRNVAERDATSFDRMVGLTLADIRQAGWVKPEFLVEASKTQRTFASAAIAGFLAAVSKGQQASTVANSRAVDLADFRRPLQARHKENLSLLEKVKRVEGYLVKEHGAQLGYGPKGLSPTANGAAWLASANISKFGNYSASRLLDSLLAVLGPTIKGTETCPAPKELASLALAIFENGGDVTVQFLSGRQKAVNQLAKNTRGERVDAELDKLMSWLDPALQGLEALGAWQDARLPDLLPSEQSLRALLETSVDGPLTYSEVDELNAKSQDAKSIIEPVALIWNLTKDLGLERLMRGLRNILLHHFLKFEADAKFGRQAFCEALRVLKPLVVRLAEVEKDGQYGMEGATPEDFALRSLLSCPEPGSRSILDCALKGDSTNARRLTNLVAAPRIKPPWIMKELPMSL
ncbi:competence protein CoiA family protein [Gemmobacter aquatilis]|nr:competence protein CoiA family protein [Gemmobacter aquatilis]